MHAHSWISSWIAACVSDGDRVRASARTHNMHILGDDQKCTLSGKVAQLPTRLCKWGFAGYEAGHVARAIRVWGWMEGAWAMERPPAWFGAGIAAVHE